MNEHNISKESVLNDLFAKHRFGIKPGLDRTLDLCQLVGNPHLKFKSIHVAGTNGKGSVCASLFSIFVEAGYNAGLYTSPHLVNFNERILVNRENIPDNKIIEYYQLLREKSDEIGATFFEITTVMAFMYFAEIGVDIAIIETGMGGRYDSTNVLEPILSIITSIDLDHQEYLGDTLVKIAYEKAGIIKKNIPCVVSENREEVYQVFDSIASKNQIVKSDNLIKISKLKSSNEFTSKWNYEVDSTNNIIFTYGLIGKSQLYNLKTIIAAFELVKNEFDLNYEVLSLGLENVVLNSRFRARIELLNRKPLIILDGAHNEAGVENLFETIKEEFPNKKWYIIFNHMSDKIITNVIEFFRDNAITVTIPKLSAERANHPEALVNYLAEFGINYVMTADSVLDSLSNIKREHDTLIFGSFYLAGEVIELISNYESKFN